MGCLKELSIGRYSGLSFLSIQENILTSITYNDMEFSNVIYYWSSPSEEDNTNFTKIRAGTILRRKEEVLHVTSGINHA